MHSVAKNENDMDFKAVPRWAALLVVEKAQAAGPGAGQRSSPFLMKSWTLGAEAPAQELSHVTGCSLLFSFWQYPGMLSPEGLLQLKEEEWLPVHILGKTGLPLCLNSSHLQGKSQCKAQIIELPKWAMRLVCLVQVSPYEPSYGSPILV